jgi:hypothetical protein
MSRPGTFRNNWLTLDASGLPQGFCAIMAVMQTLTAYSTGQKTRLVKSSGGAFMHHFAGPVFHQAPGRHVIIPSDATSPVVHRALLPANLFEEAPGTYFTVLEAESTEPQDCS